MIELYVGVEVHDPVYDNEKWISSLRKFVGEVRNASVSTLAPFFLSNLLVIRFLTMYPCVV